jgi:hypothetical protein
MEYINQDVVVFILGMAVMFAIDTTYLYFKRKQKKKWNVLP